MAPAKSFRMIRDTFFNAHTAEAALIACGSTIEVCHEVMRGHVKNAFALVRPPGHHCSCSRAAGFCFYNNVAVAAASCVREFPEICRKVAIVDWDVHHGDGSQSLLEMRDDILYISLHRYGDGFYPCTGDANECGIEKVFLLWYCSLSSNDLSIYVLELGPRVQYQHSVDAIADWRR